MDTGSFVNTVPSCIVIIVINPLTLSRPESALPFILGRYWGQDSEMCGCLPAPPPPVVVGVTKELTNGTGAAHQPHSDAGRAGELGDGGKGLRPVGNLPAYTRPVPGALL